MLHVAQWCNSWGRTQLNSSWPCNNLQPVIHTRINNIIKNTHMLHMHDGYTCFLISSEDANIVIIEQ